MSDEENVPEDQSPAAAAPQGVGPQLRAAREAKGLTLDQIAAETRISRRHLEHIEAGDFHALAGRTYAVGFARTYAKTVGLHEGDVVAMVRAEMDLEDPAREHNGKPQGTFEPGDPARAPGGKLVWFSLFAVVLLLLGIFFASRTLFTPAADLPTLTEQEEAERAAERAAQAQQQADASASTENDTSADLTGPVVFTAEGETWVRFYDAQGRVLYEAIMQEGDTYQVPADANNPMIITGRPQMLAITIGGETVPKLSYQQETVTDVPVSAAALRERSTPPATSGFGARGEGATTAGSAQAGAQ